MKPSFRTLIEPSLPWVFLLVLLGYTFSYFSRVPYAGFSFTGANSVIYLIYTPPGQDASLQVGDKLIKVGDIDMEDFRRNHYQTLFENVQPEGIVPIIVQRGVDKLTVQWTFPGFNRNEFNQRVISQWWLPYTFWFVGTVTFLLVRPKDEHWWLLVAFNYLTALWLAAGSGPSASHIFGSQLVFRAAVWLSVPVLLHLHWVFPSPLKQLRPFVWRVLYLIAIAFVIGEVLLLFPRTVYQLVFLLAMATSVLFLLLHYWIKKEERVNIRLIILAATIAFGPATVLGIALPESAVSSLVRHGSILTLPALPAAYFYAVYRRQLGGLELRANRLISIYLFMVILGTSLLLLIPLAHTFFVFPGSSTIISLIAAISSAVIVLGTFTRFQHFVEQRILGMPIPPIQLIQDYSAQITTSLSLSTLTSLMREKILPSLLIRESVLLLIDENRIISTLLQENIRDEQLPVDIHIPFLLDRANQYRYPLSEEEETSTLHWIRLVLPLIVGEELIGLWLLGRRDPDDFYSQAEIELLKSLANQTAIALTNIRQAERLRALYQTNIERHEGERTRLAHDLHDVVLNQLASMFTFVEDDDVAEKIQSQHNEVTDQLRQIIQDLRPTTLDLGLSYA
ncbi:MAG: GAF domain-containing protein, partial [Chloroflexi bacterium]|nr:GAF domain-containing protein [Chloroflexota bacterium]